MRSTLIVLLLVLAGCASGCATLGRPTLTPEQEASLADYKQLAHRVTQHYGKPDIQIMVGDSYAYGDGISIMRPNGWLVLSPSVLVPPPPGRSKDFSIAHQLGHYITGRYGCGPECEDAVNAEAVKILVLGRPGVWTERRAFAHAMSFLWVYKGLQDGGRPPEKGHALACEEIAHLAARFPQYPAKTCDAAAEALR